MARKRIKVTVRYAQAVTSSNKKRAFWMNEVNLSCNKKEIKRPYVKVFGKIKYLKEHEVEMYTEHQITVYYE